RVFDAHTKLACQVSSRLNRNHHTGSQKLFLPGCDARSLVNFQAHAVTRRMREILSQAFPFQHLASRSINFASGCSRPHSFEGRLLRFANGIVNPPRLQQRTPYVNHPRHVRTIAREYNTEITHHESEI